MLPPIVSSPLQTLIISSSPTLAAATSASGNKLPLAHLVCKDFQALCILHSFFACFFARARCLRHEHPKPLSFFPTAFAFTARIDNTNITAIINQSNKIPYSQGHKRGNIELVLPQGLGKLLTLSCVTDLRSVRSSAMDAVVSITSMARHTLHNPAGRTQALGSKCSRGNQKTDRL